MMLSKFKMQLALFCAIYLALVSSSPVEYKQDVPISNNILGEIVVTSQNMNVSQKGQKFTEISKQEHVQSRNKETTNEHEDDISTTEKSALSETTNIVTENPHEPELTKNDELLDVDNDYSFLADRMPDLPDDEYFEIDEDSTPLNFLKQIGGKRNLKVASASTAKQATNVVYITVPIFISTANGMPFQISVGGQNVPLNGQLEIAGNDASSSVPSPTSQFNRLLHYADPPRRMTNRHRSNIRIKNTR